MAAKPDRSAGSAENAREPPQAAEAARESRSDALEPPGNDAFMVLGRYASGVALDRLLASKDDAERAQEDDERERVRGIALALGILPDSVDVWFALGDYDVIVLLRNANPRTALTFAIAAFAGEGIETKTLALYDDVKRVGIDAARARTQRGGQFGRTQRGGGDDGVG